MKFCLKFLSLALLLATAASSAFAGPITPSTISFAGSATKSGSGQTTSFTNFTTTDLNGAGAGSLSDFTAGLDTATASKFTFANATSGVGELLFTITEGANVLMFYATSATAESSTKYLYTGYVIDDGTRSNATLLQTFLVAPGGVIPDPYTAELTVTPEPSSLLLMGTGLVAACGVIKRKRMAASA